jgi:hypothetical protein
MLINADRSHDFKELLRRVPLFALGHRAPSDFSLRARVARSSQSWRIASRLFAWRLTDNVSCVLQGLKSATTGRNLRWRLPVAGSKVFRQYDPDDVRQVQAARIIEAERHMQGKYRNALARLPLRSSHIHRNRSGNPRSQSNLHTLCNLRTQSTPYNLRSL